MTPEKLVIKIKPMTIFILVISLIFFGTALTFSLTATPAYGQAVNAWNIQRNATTNTLDFFYSNTGGPKALSLITGGNVGIGTTSPTTKLDVGPGEIGLGRNSVDPNRYSRIGFTDDSNFQSYFTNNAFYTGSQWNYVVPGAYGGIATRLINSAGAFQFDTANNAANPVAWNTRLYIANSGNIGVGKTTPAAKLDVNGTFRCCGQAANGVGAGAADAGLGIGWNGSGGNGEVDFYSLYYPPAPNQSLYSAFRFYSYNSTDPATIAMASPILTLNRNNKVGIGTVSPANNLHIKQSSTTWVTGGITLERSDNGNQSYIVMGGDDNLYFGANNASGGFTKYMLLDSTGTLSLTGQVFANGVQLTSSKTKKENFKTLDYKEILQKIDLLPIMGWNYKEQDPSVRHIGPFAEDFYHAFGLNNDDKTISVTDEGGVALAGVKALSEQVRSQQTEIDLLKQEIEELKKSK